MLVRYINGYTAIELRTYGSATAAHPLWQPVPQKRAVVPQYPGSIIKKHSTCIPCGTGRDGIPYWLQHWIASQHLHFRGVPLGKNPTLTSEYEVSTDT